MKITDLAIVFTAIFFPLLLILGFRYESLEDIRYVEMKYTAALRSAVQDGSTNLNRNETQSFEAAYDSKKFMRADKDQAMKAFAQTLYMNMGIEDGDSASQAALWWYIPALVVLDYDGYFIYALQSYTNATGEEEMRHQWTPKLPYAWSDGEGNSVQFTLDSFVRVYESSSSRWYAGWRHELAGQSGVSLLQNEETFEHIRRITIVNAVQDRLAYYIQRHNESALRNGMTYIFTLPVISQEEWVNTIDDVGMLAFVQGIPLGDRYYNNYAIGGARLVKSPVYFGGVDERGLKYYFRDDCSFPFQVEETFSHPKEAAAAGYRERSCRNPGVLAP
ncbi:MULTISPECIES: hypothetical protein [Paenibacillus]|uniref:F0F1-type ATP synthase n=2 Tax=Paenibacillus lactis TaxID=228574 RepID=G4HFR1_9BACL|nr:hypothetical protein [Paenibacillus lactis]EHB64578.1 hypothetical protein PaelaDRAFT_2822 [Paenibacillus lactis 154]MBP1892724.1 hypothetical protein [Paenibacillus lactis]HAF97292.1 hypothetical protein [Paenibacillus lactis]